MDNPNKLFTAKNGQIITLRRPTADDAEKMICLMTTVDQESRFGSES